MKTVLSIGTFPPCSLDVGILWHINMPRRTLKELIRQAHHLREYSLEDVAISGDDILVGGKPLTACDIAFIWFKNRDRTDLDKTVHLHERLRTRFPEARLMTDPANSRYFDSKIAFADYFSRHADLADLVPCFRALDSRDDIEPAIGQIGLPLVVKPDNLSTGRGIFLAENAGQMRKAIRLARKGDYSRDALGALKTVTKRITGYGKREILPPAIRLLAMQPVNTTCSAIGAKVDATAFFWRGSIFFVDVRVGSRAFYPHTPDVIRHTEELDRATYRDICDRVLALVKRDIGRLSKIALMLNQLFVRLDLLVDLDVDRLWLSEPEMKGGPSNKIRPILNAMAKVGWDAETIATYFDVPAVADLVGAEILY